jgi:uncharacterized protein
MQQQHTAYHIPQKRSPNTTACALEVLFRRCFLGVSLLCLLTCISLPSAAQEKAYPASKGYVSDYTGILNPETTQAIESLCRQLQDKTTAQIALVVIGTTSPIAIEQYAVELFEKWGIGQKEKDNGLLILVALNDRAIRIETGYGLEGAIPDAIASSIINQIILPEFRQGKYQEGLLSGVLYSAELIAKEYNVSLTLDENMSMARHTQEQEASPLAAIIYILFFLLFFGLRSGLLFFFILGPTGRRRGGYWHGSGFGGSSGGFGGGFGGFGGGFSGGGGATGRW